MPVPSLRSLLATPLHSGAAIPLAGTLGAVVGAGFELVFRGCTNAAGPAWSVAEIVKPALISGWMGIGCTNAMRWLDPDKPARQLQPHEKALVDYPAVRQRLLDVGTSVEDLDALKSLASQLETEFGRMITQFNNYCRSREVPPNPLMAGVIRHFYLTHCGVRGVMLLSKRSATACYLVAAHAEQASAIADALNQPDAPAGTVLRRLHCPYLRVDLANNALRDACAFTTEECDGEMRVHPSETSFEIGPLVEVTHRRSTGQTCLPRAGAAPTMAGAPSLRCRASVSVTRGPRLRKRLAELALPPDSRTWRELNRIEADLAAQRPCGHPISHKGRDYMSCDIHLDGRLAPGRNKWRLLYWRVPGGFRLEDIDDTHGPRT